MRLKKGESKMHTKAQTKRLEKNKRFQVLDTLTDGDLLIVDPVNRPTSALDHPHTESAPFILTREGKVHEIGYHYRYYHVQNIPAYGDEDTLPSLNGPQYPRNHN